MKFGSALLLELVFEKTHVYYANFWNLWFSIDLPIRNHPVSSLFTCFHVFVMFHIIPDEFLIFWKFWFSGHQRAIFLEFMPKNIWFEVDLEFEHGKISIMIISKWTILYFLRLKIKYFLGSQIFDKKYTFARGDPNGISAIR